MRPNASVGPGGHDADNLPGVAVRDGIEQRATSQGHVERRTLRVACRCRIGAMFEGAGPGVHCLPDTTYAKL